MPNVFGLVLYGDGPSSVLQMSGASADALIRWSTAAMVYNEQTVGDILIDGTNGTGHCIDASGAGGVTLKSIFVNDIPTGKSAIRLNGAAATYSHDQRIIVLQV